MEQEKSPNRSAPNKRMHPTQKPVALAEWFFDNWGKKVKVVVDLYLGSGFTLIACEKTNRICYGMEIDEHYMDVVIKRWQDFTGEEAVHENGKTYAELQTERLG